MRPRARVSDPERLAALASCTILDTAPEPGDDDIVKLASELWRTPVVLVTLVDHDRE